METLWLVLGLLACPVGMAAMGGIAWIAAKGGRGQGATGPRE